MLQRLIEPAGKEIVDIGCGGGALARDLVAAGARVVGVEVSEAQLATARDRDDGRGASYLVGTAQDLPLEDESVDVAVFMRALHHVPPADLTQALTEARRVLRPGGAIYIAEPLPEGSYFALTTLVENELGVRAAAQRAIADAAGMGLQRVSTVDYEVSVNLADVAAYHARTVAVDPSRAEAFEAHRHEIAEAFDRLGEPGERPAERRFVQPMRADVLRRPAG